MDDRQGANASTAGGDADRMAEMPEASRRVAGGTRESRVRQRQTVAAAAEHAQPQAERLLEEVLRRENLLNALKRVQANQGAPGVDGMPVEALTPYLKAHWARLREELLNGTYCPAPVRQVEIPKPDGQGVRKLGIPTVLDRFLQHAILLVLTPLFDPHFSASSFGFRPGRGCHDAVAAARGHVEAGYRWVVDLDLEKFFDRVNHDVLMARVARRVKDPRLLRLLRQYLNAGVMVGGLVQAHAAGTPQGSPVSPLLSNILLDEWDKELERRGHRFCRYADDCNIYVRSKAAGGRVMASITRFLAERLRVPVNRAKSAVARPWTRTFLGYTMTPHHRPRLKVAPRSVQRAKGHIREIVRRGRGRALSRVIGDLTPFLRGWARYFRLSPVKSTFEELDQWIRRKLRCILWRQWKRPRTRAKKLLERGVDRARAFTSAYCGRGPWWHAGASHMPAAVPTRWLHHQGLLSLLDEQHRLSGLS